MTYGGNGSGISFQSTAGEGGSVKYFSDLLSNIPKSLDKSIMQLPKDFLMPAKGTLTFWEAYNPKNLSGIPWEWYPKRSDYWLNVTDVTDPVSIWQAAADLVWT